MERIGIIGLGRMGSALARRLSAQGAEVTGWTRRGVPADLPVAAAADPAALAAAADVIVLSLYDDAAVREVVGGLTRTRLDGKLIVDTSTVVPSLLPGLSDAIAAAGARAVDAPISGGPEMVEGGTCGIFVGGAGADADRALAVLRLVTDKALHVGPLGAGQAMKAVNNTVLQGYMTTLCAALPVAKAAGIDMELVLKLLIAGPAGTPMLSTRLPKILGEDETVGFPVAAALDDCDIFRAAASEAGADTTVLDAARRRMAAAVEAGLGERDLAVLVPHAWEAGGA
ncbi:NAD-binding protein [Rhodobacterales bacterium HKCCE2091]|nr:NAD-binding protein [Rhodobacterales bacterium HKCCE2091]